MTTADDLALLRAVWVQAHADELAAFDLAAHAPTAANLTAVRSRITNDLTSIQGTIATIVGKLPTIPPPPGRHVSASMTIDANGGKVTLAEQGFQAKARRRDGGTPALAGDTGWSGPIVGGTAPGRDLTFLRLGTKYVVGMQDAVKGDWVSVTVTVPGTAPKPPPVITPTPTPTGTDGLGQLQAAMGVPLNGADAKFLQGENTRWGFPFHWTNTYAEIGGTGGMDANLAGFGHPDSPGCVIRAGGNDSTYDRILAGEHDAQFAANGQRMAHLADLQGGREVFSRFILEFDGWWFSLSCGAIGADVPKAVRAFNHGARLMRAEFPKLRFSLCGGMGGGNGQAGDPNGEYQLWDQYYDGIGAAGYLDGGVCDTDLYSNGPLSLAWATDQLGGIYRFAKARGLRIGHGEVGIGDLALSSAPHAIDAVDWWTMLCRWWLGLDKGMLAYTCLFDEGPYPGPHDFPDGRTVSFAPTNNDGQRSLQTIQGFVLGRTH